MADAVMDAQVGAGDGVGSNLCAGAAAHHRDAGGLMDANADVCVGSGILRNGDQICCEMLREKNAD